MVFQRVGRYEDLNDAAITYVTRTAAIGNDSALIKHGIQPELANRICKASFTQRELLIKSNHPLVEIYFDAALIEHYLDANTGIVSVPSISKTRYEDLNHAALKLVMKTQKGSNEKFLHGLGMTSTLAARLRHTPIGLYTGLISLPRPVADIKFCSVIIDRKLEQSWRCVGNETLVIEAVKHGASIHMVDLLYGVSRSTYRELRAAYAVPKIVGRPKALSLRERDAFNRIWISNAGMDFDSRLISTAEKLDCTMVRAWNYMVAMTVDIPPDAMTKMHTLQLKRTWASYNNPQSIRSGVAA